MPLGNGRKDGNVQLRCGILKSFASDVIRGSGSVPVLIESCFARVSLAGVAPSRPIFEGARSIQRIEGIRSKKMELLTDAERNELLKGKLNLSTYAVENIFLEAQHLKTARAIFADLDNHIPETFKEMEALKQKYLAGQSRE